MATYVLDTNVILDKSLDETICEFPVGSQIIIPLCVLEELDRFKKGTDTINEYSRLAIRLLDSMRRSGNISEGVAYKERIIQVFVDDSDLDLAKVDNRIIDLTKTLTTTGKDVQLITKDIHERVIADVLGVKAGGSDDYVTDVDKLYNCIAKIKIDDDQVQELHTKGEIETRKHLIANQFVEMTDNLKGKHYGIYKLKDKKIHLLKNHYEAFGIKPKKKHGEVLIEQAMMLHLLLDPDIQFISCLGSSGTGKTLLTLAASLEQVLKKEAYSRIVVLRPLVAVGSDIGFLPGDKTEKLENWMGATFDNLEFLLQNYEFKDEMYMMPREKVHGLINQGYLELEAMTYIRGRSIPNQIIICDDAQNITPQQATTLITRMGEGSKLIFLGDVNKQQIDNHRLTPNNNGLVYVIDKLRGQSDIIGHIAMNSVVRSELANLAVELL
ncbi:MAG TPA: PhoH family protein [Pseudoneobacillus sp.]|nr:PhoH family protein [Pseudoneobacillus sp.]